MSGIFQDLCGDDFVVIVNDQGIVSVTGVEDDVFTSFNVLMISFSKYCIKINPIKPDIGEPTATPLHDLQIFP